VRSTAAVKEDFHVRIAKRGLPKALPKPPAALYPNQLWKALTDEDRQRTLTALSQIVVKRLQPPPGAKEVTHEDR
jgi:hypothetical protein